MSKFTDKLERVYRGSIPSIGFRKPPDEENPPLLIIARLSKPTVKEAKAMAVADIDAGIISSESVDVGSFGKLVTAMGDIPLGLFLEGASQEEIAEFADSGCDFVVFGLKTPLKAVKKEGIGKILQNIGTEGYAIPFLVAGFGYLLALLIIHLIVPRIEPLDLIE